jgi:hypothetical protein
MGITLQSLVIPAAAVATFAGVYAVAPVARSEAPPIPGARAASAATMAALATGKNSDPLASAARGLVECYTPDDQRKTCRVIASYTALGGGRYDSSSLMLVSPQGPITLEINAPLVVKSGQACGTIQRRQLEAASVRVAGRLVDRATTDRIWAAVEQSLEPMINREVCTAYTSSASGMTATNIVDGRWLVDDEQQVKWIRPRDGYRVAP